MSFHLSLTSILLMANATLLGIGLVVIIRFRREAQALLQFWQSPLGAALLSGRDPGPSKKEDTSSSQQLVQSVTRLEHQMLRLRRDYLRDSAAPVADSEKATQTAALPIENAVRMARHGASVDDLTRSCGLSLGEAELMQKLHGSTPTTH